MVTFSCIENCEHYVDICILGLQYDFKFKKVFILFEYEILVWFWCFLQNIQQLFPQTDLF